MRRVLLQHLVFCGQRKTTIRYFVFLPLSQEGTNNCYIPQLCQAVAPFLVDVQAQSPFYGSDDKVLNLWVVHDRYEYLNVHLLHLAQTCPLQMCLRFLSRSQKVYPFAQNSDLIHLNLYLSPSLWP